MKLLRQYVREALTEAPTRSFDMKHFRSLKSMKDAQEYLDLHAKVIGSGMGRTAFDVGDALVVKMAQNENGLNQNEVEATTLRCAPGAPVPKLFGTSTNSLGTHAWIMVEKVRPLKGRSQIDAAISKMVKECDSLDDLLDLIQAGMSESYIAQDKEAHARAERFHNALYASNAWYKGMFDLMHKCELDIDELHEANFGVNTQGITVLLDPGQ